MIQYEYKIFSFQQMVDHRMQGRGNISRHELLTEILAEIGLQGWDLFEMSGDVYGKRELRNG